MPIPADKAQLTSLVNTQCQEIVTGLQQGRRITYLMQSDGTVHFKSKSKREAKKESDYNTDLTGATEAIAIFLNIHGSLLDQAHKEALHTALDQHAARLEEKTQGFKGTLLSPDKKQALHAISQQFRIVDQLLTNIQTFVPTREMGKGKKALEKAQKAKIRALSLTDSSSSGEEKRVRSYEGSKALRHKAAKHIEDEQLITLSQEKVLTQECLDRIAKSPIQFPEEMVIHTRLHDPLPRDFIIKLKHQKLGKPITAEITVLKQNEPKHFTLKFPGVREFLTGQQLEALVKGALEVAEYNFESKRLILMSESRQLNSASNSDKTLMEIGESLQREEESLSESPLFKTILLTFRAPRSPKA